MLPLHQNDLIDRYWYLEPFQINRTKLNKLYNLSRAQLNYEWTFCEKNWDLQESRQITAHWKLYRLISQLTSVNWFWNAVA